MCRKLIYLICFVLVLGLPGSASGGLVAHWAFDDGSGTTARDSSGNNHHGIIVGTPDWTNDAIVGGALHFDGSTYVVVSDQIGTFESFSVALWFKYDSFIPDWNSIWHNNGWTSGWLHHMVTNYAGQDIRVQFAVNGAGDRFGVTPIETDTWYFSTVTYDSTTGQMNFYLATADETTVNLDVALTVSGPAVTITPGQIGGWEGGRLSNATFDDLRMYDRVLTESQVQELFNGIPPAWVKAEKPDPPDGAAGVTMPLLEWEAGETAVFHNVYLGTDPDALEFMVRNLRMQTLYYHIPGITPGITYYWRIDEVEADGTTIHTGDVWSFTAMPLKAWGPTPADGSEDVFPVVTLGWKPGQNTTEYHVYLGDNPDDVANGTPDTDKGTTTETTYDAGMLPAETTYYWRIDAFDGTTHTGDVWSFTTMPGGTGRIIHEWWLNITGANLGALRADPDFPDNPDGWDYEDTFEIPVNWADNYGARLHGWLFPPVSGDYTFWIASDDNGELWLSTDEDPANKQRIAYVPGWTPSRDFDNTGGGNGGPEQKSALIALEKGQKYYIEALVKEAGGGDNLAVAWQGAIGARNIIPGDYVGAAPFALRAHGPSPGNGATGVTDTPTLSWSAGENAAQHDVFFGTDQMAVANADTTTAGIYRGRQNLDDTDYVPTEVPLAWDTTYYWRVDELNTADPESPWKGNVWSFTTANFIIVEDFEEYDDFCNRIFYKWKDGWGYSADPGCGVTASTGNGTGSTVGNLAAPYAEQTVVHGGNQSMPYEYNNTGTGGKARYSEASREFATPQNWARNNVKALTLWFRGETGNAPETLYVALEDSTGQVRVATHPNPEALQVTDWQQWNIALTQFSGVNLTSVKKLYIGVGNRNNPQAGGSGKLYIDDIRVYPARCVPSLAKPAADLSNNCVVDYADVQIVADQWLDSGFVVTPVDPGTSGLIAHYPLNGNANDVVGGHNGTTSGIVSYTTGKVGQAIMLDGVDDYAGTTESLLNDMAAFTLAGWVSARNPDAGRIGLFGQNDAVEFGFQGGDIHIWTSGGGQARTAWTVPILTWHHVAAVGDGTSLKVYVDGQLAVSGGAATNSYGNSTYFFNIGGGGVWDDTGNWLAGKIDEVYIYNRALSDGEVAWLAGHSSPFSISADLHQDDVIDFKDLAVLGNAWLEEILWPQP